MVATRQNPNSHQQNPSPPELINYLKDPTQTEEDHLFFSLFDSDDEDENAHILSIDTKRRLCEKKDTETQDFVKNTVTFELEVADGRSDIVARDDEDSIKTKNLEKIIIQQDYTNITETGGAIYDSARVMHDYLIWAAREKKKLNTNENNLSACLELGAGVGLNSICAAVLNFADVYLCTDGDEKTIDLSKENIKANSRIIKKYNRARDAALNSVDDYFATQKLYWGDEDDAKICCVELDRMLENMIMSDNYNSNSRNLSSSTATTKNLIILVSDCVYPGSNNLALADSLRTILSYWEDSNGKNTAKVILSRPRRIRDVELAFFDNVENGGEKNDRRSELAMENKIFMKFKTGTKGFGGPACFYLHELRLKQ